MIIDTKDLPIKIETRVVNQVTVTEELTAYQAMVQVAQEYRDKYEAIPISEVPRIQNARTFFRSIGIDPTKRRPSSEALLRRAVNGKELYQINNIVDVGNWCSLEFLLPICVYDYANIKGKVSVKIGSSQDSYLAHNGRVMNFENKFVVCDEVGALGSPLTDSVKTAVTAKTKSVLLIIFAPQDYDSELLKKQMDVLEERSLNN